MSQFIDLKEIIYVPTLRCNYSCWHCGQDQNYYKKELAAMDFYNRLVESKDYISGIDLNITGGEPFIKEDIVDFLCSVANDDELNIHISITTNGFFAEKVKEVISKIKQKNHNKISFAVSIDGTEETHNAIRGNINAYQNALETVRIIADSGIWVGVNTVLQKSNLQEIVELKKAISEASKGRAIHSCIPMIMGISNEDDFMFDDVDIKKMLPYVTTERDKKYLLSKGRLNIHGCHAGEKNICVDPALGVYTCLTGFSYFEGEREKYLVGNLQEDSLELVLKKMKIQGKNYAVLSCKGCNNPCEVIREEKYFNFSYTMDYREAEVGFDEYSIEGIMFDYNWYERDIFDNGEYLVWMNALKGNLASLYLKNNIFSKKFKIWIVNSMPYEKYRENMKCLIQINSKVTELECQEGDNVIEYELDGSEKDYIKISILCNHQWIPRESVEGASDSRTLGIALKRIEWQ